MIDMTCRCGETYHADGAHAGRYLKCRCGNVLIIPDPSAASKPWRKVADDVPNHTSMAESPTEREYRAHVANSKNNIHWSMLVAGAVLILGVFVLAGIELPATERAAQPPVAAEQPEIPPPPALDTTPVFRLNTGYEIKGRSTKGYGELLVRNGTETDAIVRISRTDTDRVVKMVYVRGGDDHTIKRIPVGVYHVAFAFGANWDSTAHRFKTVSQYARFEEPFSFTIARGELEVRYSAWEVTLHPVAGGSADTQPLNAAEFWADQ